MILKKDLKKGDKIAILRASSTDYLQQVITPMAPYTKFPGGTFIQPIVELFEMTADEQITIEDSEYIRDNNTVPVVYPKIVGPRPRNIKKR
jgi:hypothetical protein